MVMPSGVLDKLPRGIPIRFVAPLARSKLCSSVNADNEPQFSCGRLRLGDISLEEADRVALSFCRLGLSWLKSTCLEIPWRRKLR